MCRFFSLILVVAFFPAVGLAQSRPAESVMTGAAWAEFCDRMKAVGQDLLSEEFPGSEQERAEGYRHLARTVAMALQWEIDFADPAFPSFYRHNDDVTKWGGQNVDNTYLRARIDGESTYELRGDISTIADLIISTRTGDMHEGKTSVSGDFDAEELNVDEQGRFVLRVGPDVDPAKGIQTNPATEQLSIREYFTDWATQSPGEFHVKRVSEGPLLPEPLTPEDMAIRLDEAARWVEASIPMWNNYMKLSRDALPPNELRPPRSTPGGSDDIAYGGGHFEIEDDQALVIETVPPKARNWSFQYYTYGWFESPDVANRQVSLNNAQSRIDQDGKVRIVVSKQDPGIQNWIDTEGRRTGMLTYRWIWTEDKPTPTTKVVPFEELKQHLPATTPAFSAEQRQEQVRVRREHIERRFHQ